MDPLTQGLLGATCAQLATQKRLKTAAPIVGALAAMSPDLDVFIRSSQNPTLFMTYHRHFTHSLAFIPIGGLICAGFFLLIAKSLRSKWPWVCLACLVAYATHGPLDLLTSYGTLLLWPFSHVRLSLDWISIIDPIFSLPLLFAMVLGSYYDSRRIVLAGLLLSLTYLSLCITQHEHALSVLNRIIVERGHHPTKVRVMPTFASIQRYRSAYIADDKIYTDEIIVPLTGKPKAKAIASVRHYQPKTFRKISSATWRQDLEVFRWFADDLVGVFQEKPFVLADMRYLLESKPPTALWAFIEPKDKRPHVLMKRYVTLMPYI